MTLATILIINTIKNLNDWKNLCYVGIELISSGMTNVLNFNYQNQVKRISHLGGPMIEKLKKDFTCEIHGKLQFETCAKLIKKMIYDD